MPFSWKTFSVSIASRQIEDRDGLKLFGKDIVNFVIRKSDLLREEPKKKE